MPPIMPPCAKCSSSNVKVLCNMGDHHRYQCKDCLYFFNDKKNPTFMRNPHRGDNKPACSKCGNPNPQSICSWDTGSPTSKRRGVSSQARYLCPHCDYVFYKEYVFGPHHLNFYLTDKEVILIRDGILTQYYRKGEFYKEINIHNSTIFNYLNKKRKINPKTYHAIFDLLGLPKRKGV